MVSSIDLILKYQELSKRTMLTDTTFRDAILAYTLGLSGETGEVADIIKKVVYHGHPLDNEALMEELGDVLFYIAAIATTMHFNLADIAALNIEKLKQRYPEGFSEQASINRCE
ncbi:MAG: nucleoside triphosphate pyrophosphohydrolase family protein [Methanogenium sp.]|jgi:NTP pyrophosphatase (non-canonical NTP hydrolase)